jgi:hypothetical protein
VPILQRKLAAVEMKFGKSDFEAALCPAGGDVLLWHRIAGRQHRRVPGEYAGGLPAISA